jgi:uncharacterized protein (DUF58 family)
MTRAAEPKLAAYPAFAALALLAGLALQLPELVVVGAPFALVVTLGLALAREAPSISVELALDRARMLEGEELEARLTVFSGGGVDRLELFLELPDGVTLLEGDNPTALRLAPGEERMLALRLRGDRWGAHLLGSVYLRARDRFGLYRFEERLDRRVPLRVYPRPEALLDSPSPYETQVFSGNRVARQKGEGIEFADLRPFTPGDLPRRVNWRASARRAELWVNEYHPERNADVIIFLDSFAEARLGDAGTLDRAVRAAAALAGHYLRVKDRVGFVSFGGMLNWLLPASGLYQLQRIVESVLDSRIVLNYAWKGVDVIPRRTLPPQALVLALTPLLDERSTEALLDLRGRGFDLAVLEISPVPYVAGEGRTEEERLAYRLWLLERDALRARFLRAGVPVAVWDDARPLAGALEEVRAYRRYARTGR